MSDFEDPTDLARCIKSDCQAYRAGNTPLCATHLREQERSAGATSIVEPDVEARVAAVRTEDDDHPGMTKVYDRETGKAEWIPAAPKLIGQDPDTQMPPMSELDKQAVITSGKPGVLRAMGWTERPDPTDLEPHWDGSQWVLRPKQQGPDLERARKLAAELLAELGG